MDPLLIVGAGGFAREAAEAVRAANARTPTWELLGFLDDAPDLQGAAVDGIPVLGPVSAAHRFPSARLAVCTGHPGDYGSRRRITRRLGLPASRYATIVHPAAVVPPSARVGPGSVLLATVVATASVEVGSHVAIMPGVVVTHDDVIGDFVTLGAGARLAGRVRVAEGAYVGAGALVREGLTIGASSLVGMGAVVVDDVPDGQVWVGVPARFLRPVSFPPEPAPGPGATTGRDGAGTA